MLGKMLPCAMLRVVGLGLAFSGIMMLTVTPDPMLHVSPPRAILLATSGLFLDRK